MFRKGLYSQDPTDAKGHDSELALLSSTAIGLKSRDRETAKVCIDSMVHAGCPDLYFIL